MKKSRIAVSLALFALFLATSPTERTFAQGTTQLKGVELSTIKGWLAIVYPWLYLPEISTVHPVARLFTPCRPPFLSCENQTPLQMMEQNRQLDEYGSGADILEYSPNPKYPDHNHWLRTYFTSGSRPFFLSYENIYGTRFKPEDGGPKDMSDPYNRKVFREDIEFMYRNVILPFQSRYITVDGRAVIYMWVTSDMTGDFGSLLREIKRDYPVMFLGGEGVGAFPDNIPFYDLERIKALDGFIHYAIHSPDSYIAAVTDYSYNSFNFSRYLRKLGSEIGKKYIFIPTFQAAYDDSRAPGRTARPMYPGTREDMEYHASLIRGVMGTVYDNIGPFVVYNELPEGASVIESQCTDETRNRPGRYTGCGTGRLEVVRDYFGKR